MQDLRQKTEIELAKDLAVERASLLGMRFSLAAGTFRQVRKMRAAKQTIARILTELSRRKNVA